MIKKAGHRYVKCPLCLAEWHPKKGSIFMFMQNHRNQHAAEITNQDFTKEERALS